MAPELLDQDQQQGAAAAQEKSRPKGVEGEAKPTRQAEHKDEHTPPAAQSTGVKKAV